MLTVGSLFAGIGGFDLGLERAGMRTVWFCEQDKFCRRILAKHWPGVPCYPDVRALMADTGRGGVQCGPRPGALQGATAQPQGEGNQWQRGRDTLRSCGTDGSELASTGGSKVPVPVPYVDVLCGGFPCQDLSYAGRGAGIEGSRSGLWSEYARLIRELRPRYVIVENVPALLGRGLGRVLGDLAACGYDAEWDCIPASALGAPHRRDRIWLVAYPSGEGEHHDGSFDAEVGSASEPLGHPYQQGPQGHGRHDQRSGERAAGSASIEPREVADPSSEGRQPRGATGETLPRPETVERSGRCGSGEWSHWESEPNVGRVANGVPARVDRLRSLGNALVPQIAEWIGRRILEAEGMKP